MTTTKPVRSQRATKNMAKKVKPKVNPMDKKPKTTAAKKPKPKAKQTAFGSGANMANKKRSGKG